MVRSRRSILLAGGAAVAAAVLAACGAPAAPTVVPTTQPADKPAGAPAAAGAPKPGVKDVTITYWNDYGGANGKVMDQMLDQFQKDTGVKIEQQRMNNQDLNAKLRLTNQSGENPDVAMLLTFAVHAIANDGILEELDEKTLAERGIKADDYAKVPWEAALFKGKRYHIPLDVVQNVLFLNNTLFKAAGLPLKAPASRDELVKMAKQMTRDDVFGFSAGPPGYNWGFQNLLWQNGANIFSTDLKKSGLADPAAIEVAEFWAASFNSDKIAPPGGVDLLKAFNANKLAIWIHGSWNVSGLKEAKVEYTPARVPALFKTNKVWGIGHEYTFPKQKARNDAKREAAWTQVRWFTDHADAWTIDGGVLASLKKVYTDPRIQSDPTLKVFAEQPPDWQFSQPTPKWAEAETKCPPVLEAIYTGKATAKDAMTALSKDVDAIAE